MSCKQIRSFKISNNSYFSTIKLSNRFLQVSSGFIVLYDVKDKDNSIIVLKEYYQIWDLLNIKRKALNDNILILNWKDEKT